jgi:type II restriction/modification system DNA methylase subunit YeeA
MTPQDFIRKWKTHALTERASAQEHFIDLCRLVGHPTPAEDDPQGDHFTFEKGASIVGGGDGWADVWKKGFFAWEYKKRRRNLDEAMTQLTRYAAALEHPPLLVVCDTIRFQILTTWTNLETKKYSFELEDLTDPEKLKILHAVFHDPEALKPTRTRAMITADAAKKFQTISDALQSRNPDREAVAHFVNQLVFCFFADSVKLLPEGLLKKLLQTAEKRPHKSREYLQKLFDQMKDGGEFDLTEIAWFNGGLFDGRAPLMLEHVEIGLLFALTSLDWSLIDPTIFGTLFERFLDPDKRAQIGAHYTDPDKIMMIVGPVVLRPLRARWREAFARIEEIMRPAKEAGAAGRKGQKDQDRKIAAARAKAEGLRDEFIDGLTRLRVLDPACGSGNFLYLALQGVKDIEYCAINDCETLGLGRPVTRVGPEILLGIEINPFAAELARTTIWIGDIQWSIKNAIYSRPTPILRKLDSIEQRDAVLNEDGTEAQWPEADFIIGNPPFLGAKKMIEGLGEKYTQALRKAYEGRVSPFSDLVCWWFEKARVEIVTGKARRAGLVATNSIRGGKNRLVLDAIAQDLSIFEAWSDEPWINEGASVRVSLVCFADSDDSPRLNGGVSKVINSDLTSELEIARAKRLNENSGRSFVGIQKSGPFDVPGKIARAWLEEPLNTNHRPNSDVLKQHFNGLDVVRRPRDYWLINFGDRSEEAAALYEAPFAHALEKIKPFRRASAIRNFSWWLLWRSRPELAEASKVLTRLIVTPEVSKHRIFVWLDKRVSPDKNLTVIARDDDTAFGVLHSRFHEAWALRLCTWLGVGNDPRYTPTTTFETFPFPEGLTPNIPAADYAEDPRAKRIAAAAKKLDELRRNWLNPPDLVEIVPEVVPGYPDRILPRDQKAADLLKKRTLTNLYNERPTWLENAHAELDRAVAAAYGWPEDISTEDALAKLLELNLERSARQ